MNIADLRKKVKALTENGLPFMEGKEKLEIEGNLLEHVMTVSDYGFMKGEFGEYVVLTTQEYPEHFMMGASVVTQAFKNLDEALTEDERVQIIEEGLTLLFTKKKSKNKKTYIDIDFFPEA